MLFRYFLLVGSFLTTSFASAEAQAVFDPLSVPSGALVCRSVGGQRADSASRLVYVSEFGGEFASREIIAGFDSIGVPLYMSVFAMKEAADSAFAQSFVVRFVTPARGHHSFGVGPVPTTDRATSVESLLAGGFKTQTVPLTDLDVRQTRSFARWIWEHRCQSSRG